METGRENEENLSQKVKVEMYFGPLMVRQFVRMLSINKASCYDFSRDDFFAIFFRAYTYELHQKWPFQRCGMWAGGFLALMGQRAPPYHISCAVAPIRTAGVRSMLHVCLHCVHLCCSVFGAVVLRVFPVLPFYKVQTKFTSVCSWHFRSNMLLRLCLLL